MPDEQRASAEDVLRIFGAAQVAYEERDVLGCVPWRRDAAHAERADIEALSVAQHLMRVLDLRVGSREDGDRSQLGEHTRSRQVVVVNVRLERVRDEDVHRRCGREIRIDGTVGIDQERDAGIGIRDEVARVAESRVEELL